MNPLHMRLLAGLLQSCVVAAPLLTSSHSVSAAEIAEQSSCLPRFVSSRTVRLAAKEEESPAALRRFVELTYPIYRVNVAQAHDQAARYREMADRCTVESTAP